MTAQEVSQMYKQRENRETIHAALREISVNEECDKDWNNSCTALHLACSYVDPEGIQILLERGANPNALDCYGRTPLYYLTQQDGNREAPEGHAYRCATLLFAAKASPTRKDENGVMALSEAARLCRYEWIEAAVAAGARIGMADRNGMTALHIVAKEAESPAGSLNRAITELASEEAANFPAWKIENYQQSEKENRQILGQFYRMAKALVAGGIDIDAKNSAGETARDLAIRSGAKIISALLSGYDPETDTEAAISGGMNLFEAIEMHDAPAVKVILQSAPDLYEGYDKEGASEDLTGLTPLGFACRMLDLPIVRLLLDAGADPNYKNAKGEQAIAAWFRYGQDRYYRPEHVKKKSASHIIRAFLNHGWDLNSYINDHSDTALLAAARKAGTGQGINGVRLNRNIADDLLNAGADVNIPNLDGETPLMLVCLEEDSDLSNLVEIMLENGAETGAVDKNGNTPLHYAAKNYRETMGTELAGLLFEFGDPRPDTVNNEGKTALEIATEANNEPLVKLIIEHS